MVRPKRCRHVWHDIGADYFKPRGVELNRIGEVILAVEELEALRSNDFLLMEQVKAAEKMKVSQPTYSRILKEARKKVADAIVNGKAIRIQGGEYKMPNKDGTGPTGMGPGTGMGRGPCASGMGRGFGRGMGQGRRRAWQAQGAGVQAQKAEDKNFLETELKAIEEEEKILAKEKEDLRKRLESLG